MATGRDHPPVLSVVIPVYNEAENVEPLYGELSSVLKGLGKTFEIVMVDDGSADGTFEALKTLHEKDSRVRVIRFRRNFGQTAALAAGFDHARGELVVTLDADLQNDPTDIPRLLAKMDEGYDLISGWRRHRKDPWLTRRFPSEVANRLIAWVTGVPLHDSGCMLKAYRREILQEIHLYGEMHRFIPSLAATVGARISEVETNHRPRIHGRTKYGISRTFRVILDLLTVKFLLSYATRPLHFFGLVGFLLGGAATPIFLYLLVERIFLGQPLSTRPLFTLTIFTILLAVQFLTFGLLGEVMIRTYYEAQRKPIYFVRDILSADQSREKGVGS